MNSKSNLVDISKKFSSNPVSKATGNLSLATEKALSIYLEELNFRLINMIDHADDHLFDKSGISEDSRHFIAMRTLRVKKEALYNFFKQEVIHHFKQTIGKFEHFEFEKLADVEALSSETLSLVDEEDLEERIAIDSMVSKTKRENKVALEHLRLRLDAIIANKVVTEKENPFEPSFVCDAFSYALKPIDLATEFKLVLYKYFERNIMQELDLVYQEVNKYFIEQGILPELKYDAINRKPLNKKDSNSNSNSESQDATLAAEKQNEVLSLLSELLAERRGSSATMAAQQVDTSQLVNLLSNIQQNLAQSSESGEAVYEAKVEDVRAQLRQQLPTEVAGQVANGALGQFNDDMIDVVTMLFDFILDDENLQPEVKAVIARLQIPILKVGLVDKTFFSNRKHAARILLNELAHAGVSWDPSDPSSAPMLKKIKGVVEQICSELSDDVQLFEHLLENFLSFKKEHQNRATIFERRTREVEEGKARSENAKGKVNHILTRICHNKHVPQVVQKILKNAWVNVMFLESLKDDDKASWNKVCKLAQLLVWSVQPINDQERLDKLKQTVPMLIKNLKLGFNKISYSPIESSGLLDQLESTHRDIIQQAKETIEQESKDTIIRLKPVDHFAEKTDTEETKEPTPEQANIIEPVVIEEIAFSKQEIGDAHAKSRKQQNIKIDDRLIQTVENFHAGNWFEIKIDDCYKRCKLAAKIVSSGKFIFVNRSGVKVAEYFTEQLALELQNERLKILDDDELFDRALESVIANLRSMKE